MTIATFEIYRYRLPLNRPLILRGQTLNSREGLLICLNDQEGNPGWGEVAPLPGFNPETLEQALQTTRDLRFAIKGSPVPNNLEELSGAFADWLGTHQLPSSVQFGFESAVLNLLARSRQQTLAELLSNAPREQVSVNGLISTSLDQYESEIDRVIVAGYNAVKVKVGRGDIADDIAMVRAIREALPSEIALRLDANRAWEFDDAVGFARGITGLPIAYIEEPLRDSTRLPEFVGDTSLPVALDETLRECDPETMPHTSTVKAVIIRPGQLGGLERAMRFARRARAFGLTPVVSSNVESAIGIATLASFATAVTSEDIPVGLDTMSWFDQQVIDLPLSTTEATIQVRSADRIAQAVCVDRLEHVTDD